MISVLASGIRALLVWAGPATATPTLDLEAGVEILAVWGFAARITDRTHRGRVDALGLRTGFVAGPSPFFGDDRSLGGLFAAGTLDLFPATPWQLEITAGPAWVDHSLSGRALLDGFDGLGLLVGVAGRIRTDGHLQMNVGPVLLADRTFEHLVVLADLSPGWQWGRGSGADQARLHRRRQARKTGTPAATMTSPGQE